MCNNCNCGCNGLLNLLFCNNNNCCNRCRNHCCCERHNCGCCHNRNNCGGYDEYYAAQYGLSVHYGYDVTVAAVIIPAIIVAGTTAVVTEPVKI